MNQPQMDKLFINGVVLTQDESRKQFKQLGVSGDKIVAVGDSLIDLAGADTQVTDLKGSVVVPGFIDAHLHFLLGGENLLAAPIQNAQSKQQLIDILSRFAGNLKSGSWITAWGWNEHHFPDSALPHRHWLDAAAPGVPILLYRHDGHSAVASSIALELAGITKDSSDPDGGVIDRDNHGEPTGILRDSAMSIVREHIPDDTEDDFERNLNAAQNYLLERGVTAVGDMLFDMRHFRFLERMARESKLKIRISAYTPILKWAEMKSMLDAGIYQDEWFQFKGLKGFCDGSLGSHTALMLEPYDDTPDSAGIFDTDWQNPELVEKHISEADQLGYQAVIHAIGDRANREVLNLFQSVINNNGERDRRFRIEHAQHVHPADQDRFANLGVIASAQPAHCVDDSRYAEKLLGDRCSYAYPFKSFLRKQVSLAFGSDWPVSPADPVATIHAALHRANWHSEESVDFPTALSAHTRDAAYAGKRDSDLGILKPGYLADFVIMDSRFLDINSYDSVPEDLIQAVYVSGELMRSGTK